MEQYKEYKPSNIPWIGEIPSHWEIVRLKYRCSLKGRIGWNGLRSEEFKEDSYAYLVTGQDFNGDNIDWNKCYQIDQWRYDEDPFIQLSNGDLLITKDGTIGKIAKVVNLDKPACLNSGIFVMKQLKEYFDQEFLYWLLVSPQLTAFNSYNVGGSTTIQHLYQNVFENMPLIIPPIIEQKGIVDYLNNKCGSIDKVIATQEKRIEYLTELKNSIISNAVTKGINPDAPLRPSNIDWIGDIPEHWQIVRLKYRCSLKGRIGWNGLRSDEFKEDSYAYLVTGQDFKGESINWSKCYQIDKWRFDEDPFIQLSDGDLLITKDGTIGKIAKVENLDKPACLNSGIFVMKQLKEYFAQDFLYWTLISSQLTDFNNYNVGGSTTIQHLYQNIFENMPLLIPPIEEQTAIAKYLRLKCNKIEKLINKAKQEIELLKEFKQKIITDAVTGKIKVC